MSGHDKPFSIPERGAVEATLIEQLMQLNITLTKVIAETPDPKFPEGSAATILESLCTLLTLGQMNDDLVAELLEDGDGYSSFERKLEKLRQAVRPVRTVELHCDGPGGSDLPTIAMEGVLLRIHRSNGNPIVTPNMLFKVNQMLCAMNVDQPRNDASE